MERQISLSAVEITAVRVAVHDALCGDPKRWTDDWWQALGSSFDKLQDEPEEAPEPES